MTPSASRHGGTQLDRDTALILMSWECGAITADIAWMALGLTPAELFDLETLAAEQGAALARSRAAATSAAEGRAA